MTETKFCKSKSCRKPLHNDYKYKKCEFCRAKKIEKLKEKGATVGATVGVIVSILGLLLKNGRGNDE
ncbi:hypothetical protein SALIVB_0799 [Streptococcus salivarius CCHSS3]|uniref:hypothetical protein n=1 Tax=Streptococcus TaxID=1301 RepID=UPI00021463A9|nr:MULTISPECIES: hypothetical protein [Streptococcus]MBS7054089.1 hypothetical protein [Streptococcus salivarius]MDU4507580.1 hypothetical protein [Streptococcus sp.]OHQ30926.1 hypothetical protein HMPREF2571_01000 [Streptococcus sp. HMSC068F04]PCR82088.1 hypothetical protein CQA85_09345 [Streptococcus salivarius]CCB93093.1 hypothetical protein SALIVB_0799 [Streptococcus salivarius CCHSS3]